jgi:4-amino-4-deoxy-L-arabinose transferase-like glycosyltransferase
MNNPGEGENKVKPAASVRPEERWWLLIAVISVTAVLAAAARWILYHPYGVNWDEAAYFNQALNNIRILHGRNIYHLVGMFLIGDPTRPPANRLLVLPFLILFGHSIAVARFVTVAFSGLSAWFLYSCVRRLSGSAAGIIAVLVFCLSSEVVLDSTYFSTEGPLFLATAAMLYFLFAGWNGEQEHKSNWIGLGLAVGLGLLSKLTFAVIAFPVLVFAVFDAYRRRAGLRGVTPFFKAGLVAFVVAAPWWLLNFRHALGYAAYASNGYVRDSLGSASSPATWAKWLGSVCIALFGPGVSVFLVFVLVALVLRRKDLTHGSSALGTTRAKVLVACACAGLPLIAAQLSGTNHNMRFLSPTIIPLAVVVGLLSETIGLTRSRGFLVASAAVFFCQAGILVAPVLFPNSKPIDAGVIPGTRLTLVTSELPWRVLARYPQWDWKPVREISLGCGIESANISYLGDGRAFNGSQIAYPWFAAGVPTPHVTLLWRYEQGSPNWQALMSSADGSDIVITAPHYVGEATDRQDLDNQYNAEFAQRLGQDPRFDAPIHLQLGSLESVDVLVFVKKNLPCRSSFQTLSQK